MGWVIVVALALVGLALAGGPFLDRDRKAEEAVPEPLGPTGVRQEIEEDFRMGKLDLEAHRKALDEERPDDA